MIKIDSFRLPIFYFLFAILLSACQMGPHHTPTSAALLTAVRADGTLVFADSSTRPIPHYDDTSYMVIYAVRHCEKNMDGSDNPDLSPSGQARAERLGKVMDDARLNRVCTTNTKRTVQTGEAVKRYAGDPPMETFPVAAQNDWLAELLNQGGGKRYFYVGHQNTVPMLLNTLVGRQEFKNLPDDEFGRIYIAVTKGLGQTEVLELKY